MVLLGYAALAVDVDPENLPGQSIDRAQHNGDELVPVVPGENGAPPLAELNEVNNPLLEIADTNAPLAKLG